MATFLRCAFIVPLAACLFCATARAADAPRPGAGATAEKSAGKAAAGSAQKRPESSGDVPDIKERSSSAQKRDGKPAAGSAAGETGGPAATGGHTGSTTNSSISPQK